MGVGSESLLDDEARAQEQSNLERRRHWLALLPKKYSPGHRPRFVFMNLDNICSSLAASRTLFQRVHGASRPKAVRIDFEALTDRLCWRETATVVACQVATYSTSSPYLARALKDIGWAVKSLGKAGSEAKTLRKELMAQLDKGRATNNEKTLVLAMGDGGLGIRADKMTAYREVICKFLKEGWFVEIHSWLYALNDGFIELQVQYPGRVVVKPLDDAISDVLYSKKRERSPRVRHKPVAGASSGDKTKESVPLTGPVTDRPECRFLSPFSFPKSPPAAPTGLTYRDKVLCGRSPEPNSPSTASSSSIESYPADISGANEPSYRDKLSETMSISPTASTAWACVGSYLPGNSGEVSLRTPLYARSAAHPAAAEPKPAFVPPLPPTPPPPVVDTSSIQQQRVQQMQAMVAAQQADLALRQFILQQNVELMRFMEKQEQGLGVASPQLPASSIDMDPWSNAMRF